MSRAVAQVCFLLLVRGRFSWKTLAAPIKRQGAWTPCDHQVNDTSEQLQEEVLDVRVWLQASAAFFLLPWLQLLACLTPWSPPAAQHAHSTAPHESSLILIILIMIMIITVRTLSSSCWARHMHHMTHRCSFQSQNAYFSSETIHPYTGILNSGTPGDSKNAFVHCGDVMKHGTLQLTGNNTRFCLDAANCYNAVWWKAACRLTALLHIAALSSVVLFHLC